MYLALSKWRILRALIRTEVILVYGSIPSISQGRALRIKRYKKDVREFSVNTGLMFWETVWKLQSLALMLFYCTVPSEDKFIWDTSR